MAQQLVSPSLALTPAQMKARIGEIDAWVSISTRFRGNIDRADRRDWHREECARLRRERSDLVVRLSVAGVVVV